MKKYSRNNFYWGYKGSPTLLLGATDTDHLFQWTGEKLESHLDELVSAGGNYVRNTMSDRGEECVYPFQQAEDGKYDLNKWNDEYWNRFENFLQETEKRDIIVQIEVWDCWDTGVNAFGPEKYWESNPYNPKNNINYTIDESELPEEWPYHPMNNDHPFYLAPPPLNDNPTVFEYQKAFVRKLMSYTLEHENVLYTVCNESRLPERFSTFWAEFMKEVAEQEGKEIFISDMRAEATSEPIVNHPEVFDFVEMSQVAELHGEAHYEAIRRERERIKENPSPLNNTKQYGSDEEGGDFYGGKSEVLRKFWRCIFAGCASVRFHRPTYGIGLSEPAKEMIQSARKLEERVNIPDFHPDQSVISDRRVDEAYALASEGEYLVYFTDGGNVRLEVDKELEVNWLNIEESEWSEEEKLDKNSLLRAPDSGQRIAYVKKQA